MRLPSSKWPTSKLQRRLRPKKLAPPKQPVEMPQPWRMFRSALHVITIQRAPSGEPVGELVAAAKEMGMPALAVTDHGNMMAAFQFVRACNKEGIKPIVRRS